jgi:hypothetical protein
MIDPHVVDTNVPIVANNRAENTRGAGCVAASARFLAELMKSGVVVIDADWEILRAYMARLLSKGEPGIGDAFLKWVLTNQANPARCRQVDISGTAMPDGIADFDRADHKFLRTSLAVAGVPVAQASDSLWWYRRAELRACGIPVRFLCPDEIGSLSDRKYGRASD